MCSTNSVVRLDTDSGRVILALRWDGHGKSDCSKSVKNRVAIGNDGTLAEPSDPRST